MRTVKCVNVECEKCNNGRLTVDLCFRFLPRNATPNAVLLRQVVRPYVFLSVSRKAMGKKREFGSAGCGIDNG